MHGIHYAGQLPEEGDDDHVLILDGIAEVIDLPILRPEQERAAELIGMCIGIAVVYVCAGIWWAVWGVAWAVRFAISTITNRRSV